DGFWSWLSGDSGSTGVEYRLEVPRSVKLSLETVNGGIEVRGTAGDAHLETTNGQIVIAGIRGKINLETTNGSIKASGVAGSVAADTTNGGIDVHLTEVTRGAVMKFSTTHGGITVRLPKDIQTSVHASTTNGGVETDLPITVRGKVNRRRLDGDINGGGGRLDLETTNGVIHLLESGGRQRTSPCDKIASSGKEYGACAEWESSVGGSSPPARLTSTPSPPIWTRRRAGSPPSTASVRTTS